MKKFMTLLLAAGLVFSAASSASAIDFKAQGQWLVGFAGGQGNFVDKTRTTADGKKKQRPLLRCPAYPSAVGRCRFRSPFRHRVL